MMSKLIGVFGGTFDPVHNGHTKIIQNLLELIPFDEIKVIPNGQPPHRTSVCSNNDRLEMVNLAFKGINQISVDEREIHREGPSYAIHTAKEILEEYHQDNIIWIMGSDAFSEIDTWFEWEDFLNIINILVMARPGSEIDSTSIAGTLFLERQTSNIDDLSYGAGKILIVDIDPINISSTQVRSNLAAGETVNELILEDVSDYIDSGKLYTKPS
ncbi:nicotinate-nucleotide adenylyltransferase [Gammaproteobacteria bacterium]|nr:nicotinate-nucleotide adenylyltransferase [Gammaproteobacteria bacterium]